MNEDLQRRIKAQILRFDAVALLQLLSELEVPRAQIRYRANRGSAPQPTLLHDIEFVDFEVKKRGHVLITVNLGLVSCRSPLPSYLIALLASPDHGEPLQQLLEFLDNTLVGERLQSFRPELDERLVDWGEMRLDMLRLTSKRSPARLHWIFQRTFPEIGVCVRRAPARRWMDAPLVRLGSGTMGEAAFGGEATVTVFGLEVTLLCDEPTSLTGEPWTIEARKRLIEQVLPLLAETGIHLTVVLLLFNRAADARFDDHSYVDYNPLPGGPLAPARIVLFARRIPDTMQEVANVGAPTT